MVAKGFNRGVDENPRRETDRLQLDLLSMFGRYDRLVASGKTPTEALEIIAGEETTDSYVERNKVAMDAALERLASPEYMAKFAEAYGEPDERLRHEKLAALKRENFYALDIEAIHRQIRARNRQMKEEGILPPDAAV